MMVCRWLSLVEMLGVLSLAPRVLAADVPPGAVLPVETGSEVVLTGTPANFLIEALSGAGVPNAAPNPEGRLDQQVAVLSCSLAATPNSVPVCKIDNAVDHPAITAAFNTAIFTALTWVEAASSVPGTKALQLAAAGVHCGRFPHDSDSARCSMTVDSGAEAASRRRQLVLKPTLSLATDVAGTLLEGLTSAGVYNLADGASAQRVLQDVGAVACIRRTDIDEAPLCTLFERGRLRLAEAVGTSVPSTEAVPVATTLYGVLAEQAGVLADAGANLSLSAATEVVCSRNYYTPGETRCFLSPVALLQPALAH